MGDEINECLLNGTWQVHFYIRDVFLVLILSATAEIDIGLSHTDHQLRVEGLPVPLRVHQLHCRVLDNIFFVSIQCKGFNSKLVALL